MSALNPGFLSEVFRNDNPIIIAQNRQLATIQAVALAYNASGYVAGRVVARNTVSTNYENYSNSGSSGLDTAAGVLFESVDVSEFPSTTGTVLARVIFGGEVFKSKLTGLDTAAETDLGARTIIDVTGVSVLKF